MVSEDLRKIVALIIVTLSYISVPVLLFFFAVTVYINAQYVIQFHYTRALVDALVAVLLAFFNIVLLLAIRALVRWLRE